jgi:hypothetical protein
VANVVTAPTMLVQAQRGLEQVQVIDGQRDRELRMAFVLRPPNVLNPMLNDLVRRHRELPRRRDHRRHRSNARGRTQLAPHPSHGPREVSREVGYPVGSIHSRQLVNVIAAQASAVNGRT